MHEMNLHVEYCKSFGVSKDQIISTEEDEGMCFSYSQRVNSY